MERKNLFRCLVKSSVINRGNVFDCFHISRFSVQKKVDEVMLFVLLLTGVVIRLIAYSEPFLFLCANFLTYKYATYQLDFLFKSGFKAGISDPRSRPTGLIKPKNRVLAFCFSTKIRPNTRLSVPVLKPGLNTFVIKLGRLMTYSFISSTRYFFIKRKK